MNRNGKRFWQTRDIGMSPVRLLAHTEFLIKYMEGGNLEYISEVS
jgi:hypothetical protein